MNDPCSMCGRKSRGDLGSPVKNLIELDGLLSDELAQRLAVDVFSGDEMSTTLLANFKNRQDIWMVQRRRGKRFLLEPAQPLFVARKLGWQKLQCHRAAQLQVVREINLTHATDTE